MRRETVCEFSQVDKLDVMCGGVRLRTRALEADGYDLNASSSPQLMSPWENYFCSLRCILHLRNGDTINSQD